MSDQTDRWIDSALEDLAAVDVRAVVRPEVKAAVLRAWNAQQAAWGGGGPKGTRLVRGWRKAAAWVLVPAAACGIVAVASFARRPSVTPDRGLSARQAADPGDVSALPSLPAEASDEFAGARRTLRRLASTHRPTPIETGYVIVPEPFADPDALHVVRVRMARTALATLGMAIVDPDAGGLVDVEMLVGDDGVARSIRKATFVHESTDQGAGR